MEPTCKERRPTANRSLITCGEIYKLKKRKLRKYLPKLTGIRGGFTIIELLIVIVIIAILAVLVTTTVNGIQNRAKDAYIVNDIKNLSKQLENYRAENGSLPQSGALSALLFPVLEKMYYAQNPNGITTIDDFSGNIYKVSPMVGNPAANDFNIAIGVERNSDTYVIIANSSFNDVYFMDKNKNISSGTIDWSSSPSTLFITNAGLTSPVTYVRYTL